MPRSDQRSTKRTTSAKRRLNFGDDDPQNANAVVVEKRKEAKSSKTTVVPSYDDERFSVQGSPSVVLATPEKKRRRRNDGGSKEISMYFSPKATTDARKKSALVTPEKQEIQEEKTKAKDEGKQHIPIYIHKNLNYQRRGQASLDEKLKRTFDLVEEHYVIPSDFESNRSYGPLSGTCFEQRAVDAYDLGLLSSSQPTKKGSVLICTYCARLGHKQDDCLDLI